MPDKYINATKLIERLKCEKRREVAEAASNPFSTIPFAFAGPVIEVPKEELENLETEKK